MDSYQLFEPPITDEPTRRTAAGREDTVLSETTPTIREPRAESREPRAESREPRAESREVIEFTVTFSKAVVVTGRPHFEFALGPSGSSVDTEAAYRSGSPSG